MIDSVADEGWTHLHRSYAEPGIAFFLGAGVSNSSGLPNWEELARRLFSLITDKGEFHLRSFGKTMSRAFSTSLGKSISVHGRSVISI
jgi:hypothetical protein